jgi:hypothetical protein
MVMIQSGIWIFTCTGSATNTKLSSSLQRHTFPPPSPVTGSGPRAQRTQSHHPATEPQTQAIDTVVDVDVGCLIVIFSPERYLSLCLGCSGKWAQRSRPINTYKTTRFYWPGANVIF